MAWSLLDKMRSLVPAEPPSPRPQDLATVQRHLDVTAMQRQAAQTPPESPETTALRALANAGLDSPEEVLNAAKVRLMGGLSARAIGEVDRYGKMAGQLAAGFERKRKLAELSLPEPPGQLGPGARPEDFAAPGTPEYDRLVQEVAQYGRLLTSNERAYLGEEFIRKWGSEDELVPYQRKSLDQLIAQLQGYDTRAGQFLATPIRETVGQVPYVGPVATGIAEEAMRPTSLLAMLAPPLRGGTLATTALKNAALQGGLNIGQDLLLGRRDPKQLMLSGGMGAAFGGALAPGVPSAAFRGTRSALDELAQSPTISRVLREEYGGGRLPGGGGGTPDFTQSRDAFLGTPRVDRTRSHYVAPRMYPGITYTPPEPFMDKYFIRRGIDSTETVVLDGEQVIAQYDGLMLTVAPKYRRRGIAENLVYDVRTRHPELPPAPSRTPAAQRLMERVWKRIESDRKLLKGGEAGGPGETPEDLIRAAQGDAPAAPAPVRREVGEKPPTIREIEARSKPLTPDERARIHRDTDRAFYKPQDFKESTTSATVARDGDILQKVQDVAQKIPVVRSLFAGAEPMAAARSQKKLGNIIPEAMVRRDLWIGNEKSLAHVGYWDWLERNKDDLGLNGKGVASKVGVAPTADVPAAVRGRLDDIVEHPEDYVLTPSQESAIAEIRHTINAVTQAELEAGVDVREVMGPYFPRKITKGPKAEPSRGTGSSLSSRPGHVKPREFEDLRSAVAAGYEAASPLEALLIRIDTGITAAANRRTLEVIKDLGLKPSQRVPQPLRDAYLAAKEAYKANRTTANANALEQAKRELRVAATKAREPSMGEAQAFGRIFPKEVMDEIAKYTDIDDPGAVDNFFRFQRVSETTGDLSSAFIQNGNLWWRNNVAWWKALGYGLYSMARTPTGYISKNSDVIQRGINAKAIRPPEEFLLSQGSGAVARAGKLPGLKQFQSFFEWNIFVGQTEWYKAAERMAKNPDELAELSAVIRKGTGSMLRPGLTKAQRRAEVGTFFAGRFLMAVNGLAADAARGGVRGAEARKTLAMVFTGATAFTVAGQLATDGTMPNLTDPNNRDKPWLNVKRPGGTLNFYGPLYPYLLAYASISQNAAEGKPADAADDALFLGRTRLSLPMSNLIDFVYGEDAMGNKIDRSLEGFAKYEARRFLPIGPREIGESGIEGQREFPEGNWQLLGGRASRATEYRQAKNKADSYIDDANGDYAAAREAAIVANDNDAADNITYQWRKDFEQAAKPLGLIVVKGTEDPPRAPRIELTSWTDRWQQEDWGQAFADALDIPKANSFQEQRAAFVDRWLRDYMLDQKVTEKRARSDLADVFDRQEIVQSYEEARKQAYLGFWREHPDLLYEAWQIGVEDLNDDERRILDEAYSSGELVP